MTKSFEQLKMFVVGEIGVNWDGDFELLKDMMSQLKNLGLDAVKFQSFTHDMIKNHPESSRLFQSSITKDNVEKIHKISSDVEIEWFCTPMYPEAVSFLDPFVSRYKIRELDGRKIIQNLNSEILNSILPTNKEIIISSQTVPSSCSLFANKRIKWLYCIPKYPCTLDEIDFSLLEHFDGFSNHCNEIDGPIGAINAGSKILEIHVTSDKNKDFIDNPVSFDYDEIKHIMKAAKVINS